MDLTPQISETVIQPTMHNKTNKLWE